MGCCFCCEKPHSKVEVNERTPLIPETPHCQYPASPINSDIDAPHSLPKGADHAKLNQILAEIEQNIIDISSLESLHIEQQEYSDRLKHYNYKLISTGILQRCLYNRQLPQGIDNPYNFLILPALSVEEVTILSTQIASSLLELTVKPAEELIIPFGTG